jgi:peptide/nickel transport system substrate-binding protein
MYTTTMTQPDPELFMKQFLTEEQATKANKWQGRNITRWQNKEYDDTHKASQSELDPVKRAALLIKCNEMVIENYVVIPVVARPAVQAMSSKLHANMSGWDNNTWDIQDWYRDA